jgi:pimeloyl-ACP methyl ester carboxylesterase
LGAEPAEDLAGTWIGTEPAVVLVRLSRDDEGYTAVIDRPAAMSFREPAEVGIAGLAGPSAGSMRVEAGQGQVVLADRDGTRMTLRKVTAVEPGLLDRWCGWYEGDGRSFLLTQFPEGYFGEPMCLVQEGDAVARAYLVGPRRLVREDGEPIDLLTGDALARPALRVGGQEGQVLPRTGRYQEQGVTFRAGEVSMAGTVIIPSGPGPHPAAVIVHGAAGGQRDFGRLLADAVLDAGVAVLIYDKRGHGQSGGTADPTIFDQARAVSAAMDVLAGLDGIDPRRLGITGFSNGMWAAPMVAARRRDVAFVTGVGAPGVSMAESEVHRRTKLLREAGAGPATLAAVADAWRLLFGMAAAGEASPAATDRLAGLQAEISRAADLRGYEPPDYARQVPMLSPLPPPVPAAELAAMVSGEPDPELGYDPADDYRKLRCPVFLQYGSEDTSVPAASSAQRVTAAMRESGDPRSAVRVYPRLEHMLNVIPDGVTGLAPEEAMYLFHDFRFGPGVKADLTAWLRGALAR